MGKIISIFFLSIFISPYLSFAQVVKEKIQYDTITKTIEVVYLNTEETTYYKKKVATFKDNPSQVAIEKTFTATGQNGVYKVFYPSGRLKIKTVFANNKMNGEWTWYNPEGIILVKGVYKKGIKHGYWAYKSIKTYGKYNRGKKHGKWYKKNVNEKKKKAYYKHGKLIKGEGFGNEQVAPEKMPEMYRSPNLKLIKEEAGDSISELFFAVEYKQALEFLKSNVVFRKTYKEDFGKGKLKVVKELKKQFKKDEFQFTIAPATINLDISKFIKDSEQGKTQVSIIDSALKVNNDELLIVFNGNKYETNPELAFLSPFNGTEVVVYFSAIHKGLMRIDVLWLKEPHGNTFSYERYQSVLENRKFQILLFFDKNGTLKGAEYEKPQ